MKKKLKTPKNNPLIPGMIGGFADTKIKTRAGLLTRIIENHDRMSSKWRGAAKRGGGFAVDVTPFPMFRGTTKQVCGLDPWVYGNAAPRTGAPIGEHYDTRDKIGCDPLSWFLSGLITNPSIAFMSSPAAGKSTAMRVMMRGLTAHNVINMIVGDVKGEHGDQMKKDGGNHVELGPGRGCLNILDPGSIHAAIKTVDEKLGDTPKGIKYKTMLLEDLHARRAEIVQALISIQRGSAISGVEEAVIHQALKYMYELAPDRVPILEDLRGLLKNPPTSIKEIVDWDEDEDRYKARVDALRLDLAAVCRSGDFGAMFNGHTTLDLNYERGIVFDVAALRKSPPKVLGGAYLMAWLMTFGIIETSHVLADAGIAPRRQFMVWLDEFWQALAASKGIVDRVNRFGRTNRTDGAGIGYAIHTLNDFKALPDLEDRAKAAGMIERCGMVWFGGLSTPEVKKISEQVTPLSDTAAAQLAEWNNPAFEEEEGLIPGRGCFLIVRSGLPVIPVRVNLTDTELRQKLHDTSQRMFDAA